VRRIECDFGERAQAVLLTLRQFQSDDAHALSDRVVRCFVYRANGDESKLPYLYYLWRTDYRDLIVAAEYDPNGSKQLRDFN
jgi:hypothetical protein